MAVDIGDQLSSIFTRTGTGITRSLIPTATSQLAQLLMRQGATDPRLMGQQLTDIGRQTQSAQFGLQNRLSQSGINANSGLGMALSAAIGQGGANRRSRLLAQEAQMKEARQRGDLATVLGLLNPAMGYQNQLAQQALMQQQMGNQKTGALLGAAGALGGGMMAGPIGASIGGSLASSLAR